MLGRCRSKHGDRSHTKLHTCSTRSRGCPVSRAAAGRESDPDRRRKKTKFSMEETNIIYLIEIDSMVHDSIGLVASRSSLNKSIVSLCLSMLRTDTRRHSRDREFLVHRSRFLAALKTRLGLVLAKTAAMRVMINATGCPAPVSDRASMKSLSRISQLIASAIEHDLPAPF